MPKNKKSRKNTKYKNSVFTLLFNDKELLRELYCALENVTLPPDTPITVNTLQNVLFMGRLNDISLVPKSPEGTKGFCERERAETSA